MPELPDVEHFKRYIDSTSLRKRIRDVDVTSSRILEGISARKLKERLKGKRFTSTRRHGKNLFVKADGSGYIRMHFGMTGDVKYYRSGGGDRPRHARAVFVFENGYELAFINQRLLGRIEPAGSPEEFIEKKGLGPDALEIPYQRFKSSVEKKKGAVKSALMDQGLTAGVGNIYADEILYQAHVDPRARAGKLGEKKIKDIHRVMRRVLKKAAEEKADPVNFPAGWLIPSRDKKAGCPRCGTGIKKARINGRTSYFCPECQKK